MTNPISSQPESSGLYFAVQADFGITKHMGGRKATRELLELCQVRPGQSILEIGCGIGYTACYIAQEFGCRVIGVDLNPKMVERSSQRAARRGLQDRVEFRVADAQDLPFEDSLFDAVIDESVTAFVEDKPKAIREYLRVIKPGGYVGLNEVTWSKEPPPGLVKYISFIMSGAQFSSAENWRGLLESSGVQDVQAVIGKFDAITQWREEMRQLDLREYFGAIYRFSTGLFTKPVYRQFVKEVFSSPRYLFKFMDYIAFGLYVGRK